MSENFRKPPSLRETSIGISSEGVVTRPQGLGIDLPSHGSVSVSVPQRGASVGTDGSVSYHSGHASATIRQDDGMVDVGGIRTLPEVAARLRKSQEAQGQSRDYQQQPQTSPEAAPERAPEGDSEEPDPDAYAHAGATVEAVAALNDSIPSEAQRSVARSLIGSMLQHGPGALDRQADALEGLAAEFGQDAHATRQSARVVHDAMISEAAALCRKSGVDPEHFYEWARTAEAGSFASAANEQAMNASMAGWKRMIGMYKSAGQQSAAYDPQHILDADLGPGVSARRGPNGEVLVSLNHPEKGQLPEMEWSTALARGLITVRRNR